MGRHDHQHRRQTVRLEPARTGRLGDQAELLTVATVRLPVVISGGNVQGEGRVQLFHISPGEARCRGLVCNFVIKPFLAQATISLTILSFKGLAVLFHDCQNAGLVVLQTDSIRSTVKTQLCSTG